jgi:hypothetical protein
MVDKAKCDTKRIGGVEQAEEPRSAKDQPKISKTRPEETEMRPWEHKCVWIVADTRSQSGLNYLVLLYFDIRTFFFIQSYFLLTNYICNYLQVRGSKGSEKQSVVW